MRNLEVLLERTDDGITSNTTVENSEAVFNGARNHVSHCLELKKIPKHLVLAVTKNEKRLQPL